MCARILGIRTPSPSRSEGRGRSRAAAGELRRAARLALLTSGVSGSGAGALLEGSRSTPASRRRGQGPAKIMGAAMVESGTSPYDSGRPCASSCRCRTTNLESISTCVPIVLVSGAVSPASARKAPRAQESEKVRPRASSSSSSRRRRRVRDRSSSRTA